MVARLGVGDQMGPPDGYFDDGFLRGKTHLILDGDKKFTDDFKDILAENGVTAVRIPPRSPNCNPIAERFVKTIKSECLSKLILFGKSALDRSISNFIAHYNTERSHQSLDNQLIDPEDREVVVHGEVINRERLGGLLSFYHRAA